MKPSLKAARGKKRVGGGDKRPAGPPAKRQKFKKFKAAPTAAAVQSAVDLPESGDVDDFMGMLGEMEDYQPHDDSDGGASGGSASDGSEEAPAAGAKQRQRQGKKPDASGSGEEGGKEGSGAPAGGKQAKKKRRKRGPKLSAVEFEARRELVARIAECSAEEQADWLWSSYQQHAAASALERGGLVAAGVAPLPAHGSLDERLTSLAPHTWRQDFCGAPSGGGSSGGGAKQRQPGGQGGAGQPGSPTLLLVSPSAIGAVGLIKLLPQFHKACRIGKLFAKHMKVGEQEAALAEQVMCCAAGTPNRLCKLADGGALKLDRLAHVVLDVHLDAKQRDILAIPETRADWWQFYERHLKQRLAEGTLRLSLVNSDAVRGAA